MKIYHMNVVMTGSGLSKEINYPPAGGMIDWCYHEIKTPGKKWPGGSWL